MAPRRVSRLNGADGYLRWKESMLLALHTAGVAHILSDDPPPPLVAPALARQWARDDAICRGHILAALSDRLLPDYAHHATGKSLWAAVARTYGVGPPAVAWRRFTDLEFDAGKPLLEQIAHAEALGLAGHATLDDGVVADVLCEKLPANVRDAAKMWSVEDGVTMENIWAIARAKEESRLQMEAVEAVLVDSSPENHE
ncbi:hypothetical protein PR202_ga20973 [Eleusine coracana subsp. coracana]|uniref:Uncharacterized protein n=1 Tax=Eleusine coracana subsp. coracana TaxID=191504 RepID=A0AAV5D056_ELECO|nr:hypothetical protein PR202_ga20973 [Eleusine coracana subsp. coracana]